MTGIYSLHGIPRGVQQASRIRAVREGHVCALDAAQGEVLMRPGPRLAEAAQVLARCVSR